MIMKLKNNSLFKDTYMKYFDEIYGYCFLRLGYDNGEAENCTQEVFTILFKKWNSLSNLDDIRAWLYRTADNVLRNHYRKNSKNKLNVPIDEKIENNILMSHYDKYEGFEIISSLTPDEQQLLKEYYLDKSTGKELAVKYKLSKNALYVKIYRIKVKLKNILKNEKI